MNCWSMDVDEYVFWIELIQQVDVDAVFSSRNSDDQHSNELIPSRIADLVHTYWGTENGTQFW